jgi:hypothetical protein
MAASAPCRLDSADPRVVDRLLELGPEAGKDLRGAIVRITASWGNERALPILLAWLDDTEWILVPEPTHMSRAAYQAAIAILARAAPEPPSSFEEPPVPVPGPWDD